VLAYPDRVLAQARLRHIAGRAGRFLATPFGLLCLFALGLILRLAVAPSTGLQFDLDYFRTWTVRLTVLGPSHFYDSGFPADPPGYPLVLLGLSKINSLIGGGVPPTWLLKMPSILADLGIAWIAGEFAVRIDGNKRRSGEIRAIAAAAILFNPAFFFCSAVWGETDTIAAFFLLASFLVLLTGRRTLPRDAGAMALYGLAVALKPQSAFAFPAVGFALYWRYLRRRAWPEDLLSGSFRIAILGLVSVGVWLSTGLPFGQSPSETLGRYVRHGSLNPLTSLNAFNLWGVLQSWVHDSGVEAYRVAGIPAVDVGLILFFAGVAVVIVQAWRRLVQGVPQHDAFLLLGAATGALGFAFLTRVHERYLFVALVCLAPFVLRRGFRWLFAVGSFLLFLNLYFPYAYYANQVGSPSLRVDPFFGWLYGGYTVFTTQQRLLSVIILGFCLFVAWRPWAWLTPAPDFHLAGYDPLVAGGAGSQLWHRMTKRGTDALHRAFESRPPDGHRTRTPAKEVSDSSEGTSSPWVARAPLLLVGAAIAFNLWELRAEITRVLYLNDSAMHFSMMRWAEQRIRAGHLPIDGWYPYLGLGDSWFHHYQSLPHIVGAYLAVLFGTDRVFSWTLYLLLATTPLSIYWAARLFGWDRWIAGAAALVSPLLVSTPGYGYEHGSYVWLGYGMWSQLWAMWLLPIAIALSWRAVARGRSYALAALATAITIALHLIMGYLALLAIGAWVLIKPSEFRQRFIRAAIVGAGTVLTAAWVLVPLVQDSSYSSRSQYNQGTFWYDSFGAKKVLGWLFSGQLFDSGRLPVITVLVGVGIVACVRRFRRDEGARALLAFSSMSLLLFFGRPTLGPVLKLLPGNSDIFFHRFIIGVHLGGILLAGVGAVWLAMLITDGASRLIVGLRGRRAVALAAAAAVVGVVVLWPAWVERASYDARDRDGIAYQVLNDETTGAQLGAVLAEAKSMGPGRVYAGTTTNWGSDYKVGSVQVYAALLAYDADGVGFMLRTTSLSSDIEARFDERVPVDYSLFGIRYLILPPDRRPLVPADKVGEQGQFVLWQVRDSGYIQVVDAAGQIVADRSNIGVAMDPFLSSNELLLGVYPTVAFNGAAAAPGTLTGATSVSVPAGTVLGTYAHPQEGVFGADVEANRPGMVLLKATYDPRWSVSVDGVEVTTAMVAPSFVGVPIPAGRHSIVFEYHPYPYYWLLIAIGLFTQLALVVGWRRSRRRKPGVEPSVEQTALPAAVGSAKP
jgi:Gpi18-like mannosyltransferase